MIGTMRGPVLAGAARAWLVSAVALFWLLLGPTPVAACSPAPYEHAAVTLIAEGWVERVIVRPDLPRFSTFTVVEAVLRVETAHTGSAPSPLILRDGASYELRSDGAGQVTERTWAGASGSCGLFAADPTGRYALVAFQEWADAPSPGVVRAFAIGDGPTDPGVVALRTMILAHPPPRIAPRVVQVATPAPAPRAEGDPFSVSPSSIPPETLMSALPWLVPILLAVGGVASFAVTGVLLRWLQRPRS